MDLLRCQIVPEEDMDPNEKLHICMSNGNNLRSSLQVEVSTWRELEWTQPLADKVARGLVYLLEVSETLRVGDGVSFVTELVLLRLLFMLLATATHRRLAWQKEVLHEIPLYSEIIVGTLINGLH